MPTLESVLKDLVIGNRILARENVVDGLGHISARHPERPDRFFLARSRSPELVTLDDLMEFDLECRPIDQQGRMMYAERPIHGAIYKERPDVQAVVHNHAHELLPFSLTKVRLRPVFHVGGTMGAEIPVWEIRDKFGPNTNLLVTTMDQGHDLARALGPRRAALLRGHGGVVVGSSIREAIMSAIYMMDNAKVQAAAMQFGDPVYMTEGEVEEMTKVMYSPVAIDRVWEYWVRRAGMA